MDHDASSAGSAPPARTATSAPPLEDAPIAAGVVVSMSSEKVERYPLRRDVAKPAVIYQPGFGPSQGSGASTDKSPSVAKPAAPKHVPAAPSFATGPNKGKRPRPEGRAATTEATVASEEGVRSSHTPHRILAQRVFDDGVRYLVHWRGSTASNAQWVGAKVLGAPPPLAPACNPSPLAHTLCT